MLDTNEPRGIKDSSWAVAYGLCIWGFNSDEEGASMRLVRKPFELGEVLAVLVEVSKKP